MFSEFFLSICKEKLEICYENEMQSLLLGPV